MPKIKIKFKINKITDVIKKIPLVLAKHSFLTILGLFIIAIGWGTIIFFSYNKIVQNLPTTGQESSLRIEQRTYQKVQSDWQKREENFSGANNKNYPNPFK